MSKARQQSRRRGLVRKIAKRHGYTFTDLINWKFKKARLNESNR